MTAQLHCFETVDEKRSHAPTRLTGATNRRLLTVIERAGFNGVTAEEAAALLDMQINQLAARFAELKSLGFVRSSEARRGETKKRWTVYISTGKTAR